jgi:Protein of unknown function (DUF3828)
MKLRFVAIVGILVFASFALSASVRQTAPSTAPVQKWVQGFYDWYMSFALKDIKEDSSNVAIRKKSADFSPQLLRALREDMAASKKSKDEVVGLDFDPFLSSQDPDDHYKVKKVTQVGAGYLAEVWGSRNGKQEATASVVAVVVKVNGKYRFENFRYPDLKDDLLHVLKVLKAERIKSAGH